VATSDSISTQIVREAPEVEAYKLALLEAAQALPQFQVPEYQVAGLSDAQKAAIMQGFQGIGAYLPYLTAAKNAYETGMTGLQTAMGPVTGQDVSMYVNPYQQMALQPQLDEMRRQADIEQRQLKQRMIRAGAFGGGRHAMAETEMRRNLADQQNRMIAESMQQNYAQALAAAQQQQQTQSGIAQAIGNMAVQMGSAGQQAQSLSQADVDFLFGLGSKQQAQQQAELDALRATQLEQEQAPFTQLGFLSDIYKGAPSSQMTMLEQNYQQPSVAQQVIGGVGAVGTAAAGINKLL